MRTSYTFKTLVLVFQLRIDLKCVFANFFSFYLRVLAKFCIISSDSALICYQKKIENKTHTVAKSVDAALITMISVIRISH